MSDPITTLSELLSCIETLQSTGLVLKRLPEYASTRNPAMDYGQVALVAAHEAGRLLDLLAKSNLYTAQGRT